MADSLKTRVARVIASGAHALIDKLEDRAPEAVMEQSLRELDGIVEEVRHELGKLSANRHLSQQRHAELNQQHGALQDQIALALAQNREDLVRAALARQMDIEAQLPLLETSLADLARQEQEHRRYVDALAARRREMEEAIRAFRQSRQQAVAVDGGTAAPQSTVQARLDANAGAFDRLYQRQTGLSGSAGAQSLQQGAQLAELGDLVRQSQIEARLAALKQRQGGPE